MAASVRGHIRPGWMTRDIALLLSARALMSAARALAAIVVPIYLAKAGFSASRLGILFAATAIVSAVITSLVAALSDHIGRKPFIIGVPLLASISGLAFASTDIAAVLFVSAALGSFGRGSGAGGGSVGPYQPAEQAYIADCVSPAVRNSVFSRLTVASSLGALIGGGPLAFIPSIAGHLGLHGLNAYRPAFIVFACMTLAAGLLPLPIAPRRTEHQPGKRAIGMPRKSWPILRKLWLTNGLNGLAVGFFGPFVTYWFYRRFGAGPGTIGVLYTMINLAAMASTLSAASVAERLGIVRAIVATRVISALLIVPMVLAPQFWMAGAVYFVRMMVQRVGLPLRQSYVMGVVPPEERGIVAGLSNLPSQVTSAASPAFAGYLFEHIAMALPFGLGALAQLANAAVYYAFFRGLHPPEEELRQVVSPDSRAGAGSEQRAADTERPAAGTAARTAVGRHDRL